MSWSKLFTRCSVLYMKGTFWKMACEGCATKFNLFKRKKQCTDCLRYYCTNCMTRSADRRLNCEKCRLLSQRPVIRSNLLEMRSKDLHRYLMAKKISTRGCVEKEDLVNLIIQHANATDSASSNQRTGSNPEDNRYMHIFREFASTIGAADLLSSTSRPQSFTNNAPTNSRTNRPQEYPSQTQRDNEPTLSSSFNHSNSVPNSRPSPSNSNDSQTRQNAQTSSEEATPIISCPETENATSVGVSPRNIEIEELSDSENSQASGPEPLITEHDENAAADLEKRSDMVKELYSHTGAVKLSDITDIAELEALNVKQLKDLLSTNRVDYKGCIERGELLEKASGLWHHHVKSREDLEKLPFKDICKICMDAPIECVMLECGHMATCLNCGKQLSECPICRQYVIRVVRTFMP
ncbi:E3 ubiquitin-protein ligase rififylin isoform X2 [Neodiprion lecontei]|uniref:E3 ubiquitin-protein ligase rififylin isoform X2 n=1 Tax=Neodiprion lecontei TaxID=441921 RepID=A0ABM3GBX9_NEOLC|nr:E3 ubiquitin-protein ligase rififylin isoform X2 [Neodiprion lecontei]XP_046597744.1 E3 ubiquitin-protein ligase rififylin isoform X2 [Neodiprion lecontei]